MPLSFRFTTRFIRIMTVIKDPLLPEFTAALDNQSKEKVIERIVG